MNLEESDFRKYASEKAEVISSIKENEKYSPYTFSHILSLLGGNPENIFSLVLCNRILSLRAPVKNLKGVIDSLKSARFIVRKRKLS